MYPGGGPKGMQAEPWPNRGVKPQPRTPPFGIHLLRFALLLVVLNVVLGSVIPHWLAQTFGPDKPVALSRIDDGEAGRLGRFARLIPDRDGMRRDLVRANALTSEEAYTIRGRRLEQLHEQAVEYGEGLNRARLWAGLAIGLPLTALFILLLPRVGYRRRDFLMSFIPIYSCIFWIRIIWRLASPFPYWSTRTPIFDQGPINPPPTRPRLKQW